MSPNAGEPSAGPEADRVDVRGGDSNSNETSENQKRRKVTRKRSLPTSDDVLGKPINESSSVDSLTVDFLSKPQLENVEQFVFFSLDYLRPLCQECASLKFVDLISTEGAVHSMAAHRTDDKSTNCPLCSTLWAALFSYVNKTSTNPFGGYMKSREKRLAALRKDPCLLFLNPLCPDERGKEYGTLPYQLCEFSAWSSNPDNLDTIELYRERYAEEYSYRMPVLQRGMNMASNQIRFSGRFIEKTETPTVATATFTLETSWGDPLHNLVRYKSVLHDPSSQQAAELINSWVEKCAARHSACNPSQDGRLPTRLIDVGIGTCSTARLVMTSGEGWNTELDKDRPRYLALSYCWGSSLAGRQDTPAFATTSSTLKGHTESLPLDLLPRTLLDAIQLTRNLGLRYLWADSLCIIQGTDAIAREDWATESSLMANVYGGAWLTVAASWGSSMHAGIFRNRPEPEIIDSLEIGLQSLTDATRKGTLGLVPKHLPPVESMLEPLYRRGWALQERILSKRVLICNRDQFVWECQCDCFTESGFRMQGIGAMRMDREFHESLESDLKTFQNTWQCIVTDYCAKLLTEPSDKLPAIGGLARQFLDLSPNNEYIAGLWIGSILDDLLWVHSNINYWSEQSDVEVVRSKPLEYRAPSWSWASVDGGVRWPFSDKNATGNYYAKMINHHVSLKSSNTFGELGYAHLTLEAPLWHLPETMKQLIMNPEDHPNRVQSNTAYRLGLWQQTDPIRRDIHMPGRTPAEVMGQARLEDTDLFFLKIRDDVSLILASSKVDRQQSESSRGAGRCYERLGVHGPTPVIRRFVWPEGVSPEYVMATCRLI